MLSRSTSRPYLAAIAASALGSGGPAHRSSTTSSKVPLEACRRDDLQDACLLVAVVPEGVPLTAGLEDEVAGAAVDDVVAEQRAHPPFEHEAVLVLTAVAMERRGQRPWRHGCSTSENPPPDSSPSIRNRTPIQPSCPALPSVGPSTRVVADSVTALLSSLEGRP
jgi:hypothetical protein